MNDGLNNGAMIDLRAIVSFEENYNTYRDTLAAALKILRPDARIMTVKPEEIGATTKWFAPDVVIGNPINVTDVENVPAWVELSLDPTRSSRLNVRGYYSEIVNPTLDRLVVIIEEVAPMAEKGRSGKASRP